MGRLLEACEAVGGGGAELVWVSEDFLEEQGVEPFTELPLWVPREYDGLQAVDCGRAIAAGLSFPAPVRDDKRRARVGPQEREADLAAGLRPERERELLSGLARWQPVGTFRGLD